MPLSFKGPTDSGLAEYAEGLFIQTARHHLLFEAIQTELEQD